MERKKYLPEMKQQLEQLEKIEKQMFEEKGLSPELSAMSDRVNKLKSTIKEIESSNTPVVDDVVKPVNEPMLTQAGTETAALKKDAPVKPYVISQKRKELESLKKLRMATKEGSPEYTVFNERINKLDNSIKAMDSANQNQVSSPPASGQNIETPSSVTFKGVPEQFKGAEVEDPNYKPITVGLQTQ